MKTRINCRTTVCALIFALLVATTFLSCGTSIKWSNSGKRIANTLNSVSPRRVSRTAVSQRKHIIFVRNQKEFERINSQITEAINNGIGNIVVKIAHGTYFYGNGIINRENEHVDASITIEGDNAILIAKGKTYHNGDSHPNGFNTASTLVNLNTMTPYTCWDTFRFAEGLIEVVNEKAKLCRLHHSQLLNRKEAECAGVYINITEWYQASTYKVKYIKDGWVFFEASNLSKSSLSNKGEYNINDDYIYGKVYPRFRLSNYSDGDCAVGVVNGRVKTKMDSIYECENSIFLNLKNAHYKSFTIKNLRFIGNTDGAPLMILNAVEGKDIKVSNCTFESISGRIMNVMQSKNIMFDNNTVDGCQTTGLCFRNGCENIRVTKCLFEHGSRCASFSFFVQCEAKDFYIANNTFRDFGYSAIGVGMMRGSKKDFECSGIIEHNEIYFTEEYFKNKEKYTSMDAGAIQVRTQSDGTIIRYNYIHDYVGMKDNRGIFCDEGARNFKIYNNVILNTPNCYSIDARRVADKTKADTLNNCGNVMMYNIVDGRIRFVGRDKDNNGCVKIGNVLLSKKGASSIMHQYDRFDIDEEDIELVSRGEVNKVSTISDEYDLKVLRTMPGYTQIKKYLKSSRKR